MSEGNILDTKVPDTGVDVETNMTSWYNWLVSHIPETIRRTVSTTYKKMKDKVMSLFKQNEIEIVPSEQNEIGIVPRKRLLNNAVTHYHISSHDTISPFDFLNRVREVVIKSLKERPRNKIQINLICEMMRLDPATGDITNELASFNSKQESVFSSTDLETMYERMITKILEAFSTYLRNGSGWMLKKVMGLDITVSRLRPIKGPSYIPLPNELSRTKGLINMQNMDQQCFKWAVTRVLNPVDKDQQRVTKIFRKQSEELNWEGIEFPTLCSENIFKKFERNNNGISLLVFGHEKVENKIHIIPLYVPTVIHERTAHLDNESHYCVVSGKSALISSQVSGKKSKKYVCDYCLNYFGSQAFLDKHTEYCSKHDAVTTILPEPGKNTLKFKSVECPIKIYADFESFLKPINKTHGDTKLYQEHVLSAFCLYVVSRVEGFSMDPVTYVKQDETDKVDKIIINKLDEITKQIYKRFNVSVPMVFDEAAKELHESQNECYSCGNKFNGDKVRDHVQA